MSEIIKVCVDRVLSLPLDEAGRMVLDPRKMWRAPQDPEPEPVVLEVGFMDGDPGLCQEVLAVASEWSKHANVEFAPSTRSAPECDIRISFALQGAWSYLGKDAEDVPKDQPTMNFGFLTPQSPQEEIRRVVLHEFGHALGCAHEHFHPDAGIPWNKPRVYEWYRDNFGWDEEMVNSQVLERYDRTLSVYSTFDHASIMLYAIPAELTDGKFHTDLNLSLSPTDQAFIAKMYPKPKQG